MIQVSFKLQFKVSFGRKRRAKAVVKEEETLGGFAGKAVRRAKDGKSSSTACNYATAVSSFKHFSGEDVPLEGICKQKVSKWQKWLRDKGLSPNTVSCYVRSLRSLYNQAVECGKVKDRRPFQNIPTPRCETAKRALSSTDIRKIMDVELPKGSFDELSKDLFLFQFYAQGMPFVDMARLKRRQVESGRMTYHRRKTNGRVSVALEPCIERLIGKYASYPGEYVFPIMPGFDGKDFDRKYHSALCRYNCALKRIARLAGVEANLTSYSARHTWASEAYGKGVDICLISKAMGHANTRNTLYYISGVDDDKVSAVNKEVITSVSNPHKGEIRHLCT